MLADVVDEHRPLGLNLGPVTRLAYRVAAYVWGLRASSSEPLRSEPELALELLEELHLLQPGVEGLHLLLGLPAPSLRGLCRSGLVLLDCSHQVLHHALLALFLPNRHCDLRWGQVGAPWMLGLALRGLWLGLPVQGRLRCLCVGGVGLVGLRVLSGSSADYDLARSVRWQGRVRL